AETLRLVAHFVHQLWALDALGEAREVLHLGGLHQQAAEVHALEDDRLKLGAGGVDRGGVAGWPGAHDDTDEEETYNDIKKVFIKRVRDECKEYDVLFILEPVSYSSAGLDSKGHEFAKKKPAVVEYFMEEFSKESYGIDLLKVEVPVSIYHIEG